MLRFQIDKSTTAIASKIIRRNGKVKLGIKTKAMFSMMRLMQKNGWNERDVNYWKEKGWADGKKPWK
ncbi:MAG: hypothetical protein IJ763_07570 [Lachnospiraceae bacterium]|nr:hypothetical protein [Lachnospiraceae bacterium]